MEEAAYAESRPVCPISIVAHVAVQEHAAPMTFARVDDDASLDTPLSAETALCRRWPPAAFCSMAAKACLVAVQEARIRLDLRRNRARSCDVLAESEYIA